MVRPLLFLFTAFAWMPTFANAAEPKPFTGKQSKWQTFDRFDFKIQGLDVTVVVPESPKPGKPWVWRGEFFGAFADADVALVKAGWHIIFVSASDLFGSPKAQTLWDKVYASLVTEYGMHPKPGLIGLSRGGLYCMNWAATHPDQTLAVYLDNAVCDFKSWPGGMVKKLGTGKGSEAEWKKLLKAFDFKNDEEAIAYKLNPVDNLAPLAKANIPLLLVYGDKDTVVPGNENSAIIYDRYRALGGSVQQIVKPGNDHHPHGLKDVTPVVTFFNAALEGKLQGKSERIVREEIEWLDVWVPGNNSRKNAPRVLLIGDSIARGYYKDVEDRLKTNAVVGRLTTSKSLGDPAYLGEVKLILSQTDYDVVHVNNGLHGWGYSEAEYEAALPKLIETIRAGAPKAKIVWATTTPMRDRAKLAQLDEKTERVKARNAIAVKLMKSLSIPVDDLFAVGSDSPELFSGDGVHFNAKGSTALATKVSESILPLLSQEKGKK